MTGRAMHCSIPPIRTIRIMGNVARGSNPGIDRGLALFVEFGFLAEENHGKNSASIHGCKGL